MLKQTKMSSETIPIDKVLHRVLASDITADADIPSADRAAMDGYAVTAEDTFGASDTNPAELSVIGSVRIGETPSIKIDRGQAAAVATGSYLPRDADAVVMVEYTRVSGNRLQVVKPVVPDQNVAKRGEDVKKGMVIVKKGTKVTPQDIGIIAAQGITEIQVVRKPRVALISTGDELIDPGEERREGKIYDINRHICKAAVFEAGGEPIDLGIVGDNAEEIKARLMQALSSADIILISAGTSVGERDLVPGIMATLDGPGMLAHGIALRPGYPTGLAVVDGKPVISLPGYPVSNAIAFRVIVRPLLAHFLGSYMDVEPTVRARLARRVAAPGGLRTFVRVRLVEVTDSDYGEGYRLVAEPIMASGAGVISSLALADALLIIPEDSEGVDEGEDVEVVLLRPLRMRRIEVR